MANYRYMMSAEDIAKELNCSKSYAYKIVKELNRELAGQGYMDYSQDSGEKYSESRSLVLLPVYVFLLVRRQQSKGTVWLSEL